jgi:hypothetical protein
MRHEHHQANVYILSRVLVIIDGDRMDDCIYYQLIRSTRTYKQYSSIAGLHNLQFTITQALWFSVFTSRILATELNHTKSSQDDF